MKLNLSDIISYLFLVAGVISIIAGYLQKYDRKHAQLWEDLKHGADAIVAQQNVMNTSNDEKKEQAVSDLQKQMSNLGHKVTKATVEGAIERAVDRSKDDVTVLPTPTGIIDLSKETVSQTPAEDGEELTPVA